MFSDSTPAHHDSVPYQYRMVPPSSPQYPSSPTDPCAPVASPQYPGSPNSFPFSPIFPVPNPSNHNNNTGMGSPPPFSPCTFKLDASVATGGSDPLVLPDSVLSGDALLQGRSWALGPQGFLDSSSSSSKPSVVAVPVVKKTRQTKRKKTSTKSVKATTAATATVPPAVAATEGTNVEANKPQKVKFTGKSRHPDCRTQPKASVIAAMDAIEIPFYVHTKEGEYVLEVKHMDCLNGDRSFLDPNDRNPNLGARKYIQACTFCRFVETPPLRNDLKQHMFSTLTQALKKAKGQEINPWINLYYTYVTPDGVSMEIPLDWIRPPTDKTKVGPYARVGPGFVLSSTYNPENRKIWANLAKTKFVEQGRMATIVSPSS